MTAPGTGGTLCRNLCQRDKEQLNTITASEYAVRTMNSPGWSGCSTSSPPTSSWKSSVMLLKSEWAPIRDISPSTSFFAGTAG